MLNKLICEKCGKKISIRTKFCGECGSMISEQSSSSDTQSKAKAVTQTQGTEVSRKIVRGALGSLLSGNQPGRSEKVNEEQGASLSKLLGVDHRAEAGQGGSKNVPIEPLILSQSPSSKHINNSESSRVSPKLINPVQCYSCGSRVSKSDAISKIIEVETGRSGSSVSIGGLGAVSNTTYSGSSEKQRRRKTNGVFWSINSGRSYYKRIKVILCKECARNSATSSDYGCGLVMILIIIAIIVIFMFPA